MYMSKVLDVTDKVKWIGVLDKDIVTFDIVMETKYGTTYNSYLINAKKKTLVETVKEKFFPEYLEKIKSQINPSDIEYIILNHTEPDHSGSLVHILKLAPNAKVVGSRLAINYMEDFLGTSFPNIVVKDGDQLDLGDMKIKFIGAPNLHWPDSMYSYLEEEKVLFTCDSFGAHFANEAMYDDKVGNYEDSFKYYFDVILKPYSKFMVKAIEKIRPLDIKAICPGHGPLLTTNWKKIVDKTEEYAKEYLELPQSKHVLIAYISIYSNTKKIAEKLGEVISSYEGFTVNVCDIEKISLGELDANIAKSAGIIVGSPTVNQNTLLPVYKLFACINPLRDRNKIGACFGSYGWSGEASKIISDNLKNLKLNVIDEFITFKFSPHQEAFEKCNSFGKEFVEKLRQYNQ
ncbi:MAG: FprA family A-type flavoprotein [Bacteroidota bacterium]|nr:FprA family A-type flavoprotein [Bacteroidota bacterium]